MAIGHPLGATGTEKILTICYLGTGFCDKCSNMSEQSIQLMKRTEQGPKKKEKNPRSDICTNVCCTLNVLCLN